MHLSFAGEDDVAGDGVVEERHLTWMEGNSSCKSGAVARRALPKNLIRPHWVQDRKDKGFGDLLSRPQVHIGGWGEKLRWQRNSEKRQKP